VKSKVIVPGIIICIISLLLAGCIRVSSPGTIPFASGSGILNLADTDPTTLDPAVSTETTSVQYIMQIFSGLVKLDSDMQPAADIAERWQVSPDGTVYTFYIKKGVKFQSGREVKAEDFVYSWQRAVAPSTGSKSAGTYLGDIAGIQDALQGKTDRISGLKIIDEYTLQVTIDQPLSYFLYKMSYPTTFVVDRNNVGSGPNWWRRPNGTGPFKLDSWVQGQSLTLARNDGYYGEKAKLEKVQYQFYSGIPIDLYETGRIDVTGVSTSTIDKVQDPAGPFHNELTITPSLGIYYIGFKCDEPPFDDVNVRKAFSYAADKQKIIELVLRGMEEKAEGILPPGMPGYNENVKGLEFNLDLARQSLQQSKYGSAQALPPITLTTSGYAGAVGGVLQALLYDWQKELGISVSVRQLEPEYYFYNTRGEIDQMFEMGWSADYPHPQDFLDILFSEGSAYNYGDYSNPDYNTLISQANRTISEQESFNLYRQAEQILVNDAACIPVSFSQNYTLIKPYVSGYLINPLGFVDLSKVSVTEH